MKFFEALEAIVEDLIDGFTCFLRRSEPTIPHEEVIAKLTYDGKVLSQ